MMEIFSRFCGVGTRERDEVFAVKAVVLKVLLESGDVEEGGRDVGNDGLV